MNNIRDNSQINKIFNQLSEKSENIRNHKKEILKLYTHNVDVDNINLRNYLNLTKSKKEYTYNMSATGKKNIIELLKKNCLAPENINLKIGAKIIFIKNDKLRRYQNGTLGEVIDFNNQQMPIIETYDGDKIALSTDS